MNIVGIRKEIEVLSNRAIKLSSNRAFEGLFRLEFDDVVDARGNFGEGQYGAGGCLGHLDGLLAFVSEGFGYLHTYGQIEFLLVVVEGVASTML